MNKFICNECGTKYSSPETTPPPGIKCESKNGKNFEQFIKQFKKK